MKIKAPPRIEVRWLDAHQLREEAELDIEEAIERAHCPLVTTTSGYLVKSDAVGITLAGEWQENEGQLTFRCVSFIPRGMVSAERVRGKRTAKSSKPRKPMRSEKAAKSTPPPAAHDTPITGPTPPFADS